MDFEIGFLGYGKMSGAVSRGLDKNGLIPFNRQMASARDREKLVKGAGLWGLTPAADNRELVKRCRSVVLGVKPKQIQGILEEIQDLVGDRLIISMAAGVRLEDMRPLLPRGANLVRTMPNVAALTGQGATIICAAPGTSPDSFARAVQIFGSVGRCFELDENLFDAGGAVSGSGPAYFFSFMENLIRGAVRLGLPWDTAKALVLQTALGSAETAAGNPETHLADLRDMVTSPGGTTAEALAVMENHGWGGIVQQALAAANDKSKKLC